MIAVSTDRVDHAAGVPHRSRTLLVLQAAALTSALTLVVPAAQAAPRSGPGERPSTTAAATGTDEARSEEARDGGSGLAVVGTVRDGDLLNRYSVVGAMGISGLAMVALAGAASGTPAFAATTAGAPDAGAAGAAGAAGVAVTAPGSSGAPVAAVPAGVTGDLANGPAMPGDETVPVIVNPEPATVALLAGGLVAVAAAGAASRRRRNAA